MGDETSHNGGARHAGHGQIPMPPSRTGPRPTPNNPNPVNFGPNVLVFDPSMTDTQSVTDAIFRQQDGDANQFGPGRYAYLFKPGQYNLNVQVGYYTTVHGLGHHPDDVTITGGVQTTANSTGGIGLNNFWRGAENLAVTPTAADINMWAVSQATYLRRFHVKGEIFLFDFLFAKNFTSGGFMADSMIDKQVISGSQQQFLTRNCTLTKWIGGVWNMVFVGDQQPPSGSWPDMPYTVVDKTPVIREKPYLVIDSSGNYAVQVPILKRDSQGTSWASTPDSVTTLPIQQFYIAKAGIDTADSLNNALQQGYHLILTPGIYQLASSLEVNYADTVILGLGMATLFPERDIPAMTIADVDGVSVSGILFDAGPIKSSSLLVVGPSNSNVDHSANPTVLYDLSSRVGGAAAGLADNCFTINSNNVILDNVWLWRADHGSGVGWDVNAAQNGLIVNGQDVTAYGLFVEHFESFQTLWNGNGGSVYLYQSEIPYDVPSQDKWKQQGVTEKGFPSYKVSNQVTTHTAKGLGIYSVFDHNVQLDNAIETPQGPGIQMEHLVTVWIPGQNSQNAVASSINHIINGTGNTVSGNSPLKDGQIPVMKAQM